MNDLEAYIQEVELINFFGHEHSIIQLVKGMNLIVGTSNHGKTTILRGIDCCLGTRQFLPRHIRNGQDMGSISLTFSDGVKITRRRNRTSTINEFELNVKGVSKIFTGFGTKTPPEILEQIPIDRSDITVAKQLETAFLLSETPKRRAEIIGNLDELVAIDLVLKDKNDELNAEKKTLRSLHKMTIEKKKTIETLEKEIEDQRPTYEEIKKLKASIQQKETIAQQIDKALVQYRDIQERKTELKTIMERASRCIHVFPDDIDARIQQVRRLHPLIARLKETRERKNAIRLWDEQDMTKLKEIASRKEYSLYPTIEQTILRLRAIQKEKQQAKQSMSTFEALEAAELPDKVSCIEQRIKAFVTISETAKHIKQTQGKKILAEKRRDEAQAKRDAAMDNFIQKLKDAQLCPTCGQNTENVTCVHI